MSAPITEAKSLDAILESFELRAPTARENIKSGGPITIWLAPSYKIKYDQIQKASGGQFIKVLRKLAQAALDRCDVEAAEAS